MSTYQPPAAGQTTVHRGGWVRLRSPLPFALRYVNAYLIPSRAGFTLIDPGLRTDAAEEAWQRALTRHGVGWRDITRIVLTHQHPDHYGMAGWFQERTGAPVLMSEAAHAYAVRLWGERRTFAADLTALYAVHGMPEPLLAQMPGHLESFVEKVTPQPDVTYIREGEPLAFGDAVWEPIHTPGHAEGHLCFYQAEARVMLCGDQVLPDITPNVSVVPGEPDDVLQRFLDSLDKLAAYDVEEAYPGHREPFTDFAGRIRALKAHHARRLSDMQQMLSAPLSAYDVCERLFGARIGGNVHQLRFAMSETLAHLFHLERGGLIVAEESAGGMKRYRAV